MNEVSDYIRKEAIVAMADDIISLATSMREAFWRGSLELGDAHFDSLALVAREVRRTRAEMSDKKKGGRHD